VRDVFDMRPAALIERLDLRRPIFKRTAAYGHFGRTDGGDGFTWENTAPYADQLKAAASSL
jgi:S-adenosylmethionine synthetase